MNFTNQGIPNSQMYQPQSGVQNLSNLYPSVYKIVNPVITRVLATSNNSMINEEYLNNMVDTVYNIVEGQIEIGDDTIQRNTQQENTTQTNASTSRNQETTRQQVSQTNSRNTRNDSLLRDLIKILIIKDILFKNQLQRQNSLNTAYNYPMMNY